MYADWLIGSNWYLQSGWSLGAQRARGYGWMYMVKSICSRPADLHNVAGRIRAATNIDHSWRFEEACSRQKPQTDRDTEPRVMKWDLGLLLVGTLHIKEVKKQTKRPSGLISHLRIRFRRGTYMLLKFVRFDKKKIMIKTSIS